MAIITHVQPGDLARAAHQNGLIDQVNANTAVCETIGTGVFTETDTVSAWATAVQNRLDKLPGAYYGAWTDDNTGNTDTQVIDASDSNGEKVMVYTNQLVTPTGMSMSNGTVTVANAGLYLVTASIQVTTNNGSLLAMWIANSSGSTSSGVKYGPVSGYRADALSSTALMRLPANSPISVYAAVWQGTPAKSIWKQNGNNLVVCYLGP